MQGGQAPLTPHWRWRCAHTPTARSGEKGKGRDGVGAEENGRQEKEVSSIS